MDGCMRLTAGRSITRRILANRRPANSATPQRFTFRADRGIVRTMPRLALFPFRYRDRVTGKWVKARHVAERHDIAARYAEWEIIGPPEIGDVDPYARYFTPWKVAPQAELMRMQELPPELQPRLARPPTIDLVEASS